MSYYEFSHTALHQFIKYQIKFFQGSILDLG
jgi:hypothetical protein